MALRNREFHLKPTSSRNSRYTFIKKEPLNETLRCLARYYHDYLNFHLNPYAVRCL
nr:MAG TPA: hypothetical protein [Bacteriophage sp.]